MTSYESSDFHCERKGYMSTWLNAMIWLSLLMIAVINIAVPIFRNLAEGVRPVEGIRAAAPVLIGIGIVGLFLSGKTIKESGWHCALPPVKMAVYLLIIALTTMACLPLILISFSACSGSSFSEKLKLSENWNNILFPSGALLTVYLLGSALTTLCFALCKTIKEGTVIIPSRLAAIISGALQALNIFVFLKMCGVLFQLNEHDSIKDWVASSVSTSLNGIYTSRFHPPADIRVGINVYMVIVSLAVIAVAVIGTSFGKMYREFNETVIEKGDGRNRLSYTGYCVWCQDYSVPLYRVYHISYGKVRKPSQKLLTDNGFDKLRHSLESGKIYDINVDSLRSEYVMSGSANPIANIDEKKIPVDHWCCQRCGMTIYESLRGYSGEEPAIIKIVGAPSEAKKNFCTVIFRDYAMKFMRPDTAEYIYFSSIALPQSSVKAEKNITASAPDRTPAMTFRYKDRFAAISLLSDTAASCDVTPKDVIMVFIDASEFKQGSNYFASVIDAAETIRAISVKVSRIVIAVAGFDIIGRPEVANRCNAMDNPGKSSARNSAFRSFFKSRNADVFEDLWNECKSKCDKVEIVGHTSAAPNQNKDSHGNVRFAPRHINETLDVLIG